MPATKDLKPTVLVWDILIRIFHWSFAILITLAWFSHEWRGSGRLWHEWLGYAALGLAALRIIWGLVGSKYARFTDFVHLPSHYFKYFAALLRGREKRYLGHNPIGGLMVVALLLLALGSGVSGYVLTQRGMSLFGMGHRQLEGLHGLLGNLFLIAVPLHILGVIWESFRHRENLILAMINGRKRTD